MSDITDVPESEEADEFERKLTQALGRVEAPRGFAARVIAAHVRQSAVFSLKPASLRPRLFTPRARAWAGGALAAALAIGVFTGGQIHLRREREQAALANRQFATALRVTDHALDQTRSMLERPGLNLHGLNLDRLSQTGLNLKN